MLLLEAMLNRGKVLSTDAGGRSQMSWNGDNGIIINREDQSN